MKPRKWTAGRRMRAVALGTFVTGLIVAWPAPPAAMARGKHAAQHYAKMKRAERARANAVARQACADAYEQAALSLSRGHVRDARESAGKCADPRCGRVIRHGCVDVYKRADMDIATVIPTVPDVSESVAAQVDVQMDGRDLVSGLDGRAIAVDPGQHRFTFSNATGSFATVDVQVRHGEHNKLVEAAMRKKKAAGAGAREPAEASPPEPAPAPPAVAEAEPTPRAAKARDATALNLEPADPREEEPPPRLLRRKAPPARAEAGGGAGWPTYALGGVGLLGVGGFVALTLKGRADNDTLIEACKPDCNPASVHHVRMVYLAADASLGVGLVALAASTWLYFHSSGGEPERSRHVAKVEIGTVDVQASGTGAVATIGGRF